MTRTQNIRESIIPNFDFSFFLLLRLAIVKYQQYFLMLQTLKRNNENGKKRFVLQRNFFIRLKPGVNFINVLQAAIVLVYLR